MKKFLRDNSLKIVLFLACIFLLVLLLSTQHPVWSFLLGIGFALLVLP